MIELQRQLDEIYARLNKMGRGEIPLFYDGSNVGIGTNAPAAKLDVKNGYIRALDGTNTAPATGTGVNIVFTGGNGYIISYNHTAGTYQPMNINGSSLILNTGSAGVITLGGTLQTMRSSGAAVFAIDGTQQGSAVSVANNNFATPFGTSRVFSGLILITETAVNGSTALFIVDGAATVTLIQSTSVAWSNAVGTASKTNVYITGTELRVENKLGSTATYNVTAIRNRTS